MWPWEHALFAYGIYSLAMRATTRGPPAAGATLVLAFASTLPDLVDKSIAWQLGLLASGYGPAHSLLIAVPVAGTVLALARWRGRLGIGVGYALGHLLHIVGDVVPLSLQRGELYVAHVLWPVGGHEPTRFHDALSDGVLFYFTRYAEQLLALDLTPIVLVQLGSAVAGVCLWLLDGRPGWGAIAGWLRRGLVGIGDGLDGIDPRSR